MEPRRRFEPSTTVTGLRRVPTRLVTIAVCAGLVAAACTSERQSTPPSSSPSDNASTSLPEAVESTDPPTSMSDTSTTSSSTTSTTTPMPTTDIVELFIGGGEGAGWLPLGTWESDHWESPAAAPPTSASGTAMSIANLDGVARGRAGGNIEACLDGRLGPDIDATVSPPEPPGFGYGHIALATPDWPLAPRPVAVTATGPARYQTIGEEIFAGRPVDPTDGGVEQVVVGDLDGDGDDEAIVTFEFIQPAITGAAGDFAALFVVDADTGSAQTVYETHVPAPLPAGTLPFTERFRVIAVADLNGDGRMEVAVHSWYYEGASVELFEYDGATLIPALGEGCGS